MLTSIGTNVGEKLRKTPLNCERARIFVASLPSYRTEKGCIISPRSEIGICGTGGPVPPPRPPGIYRFLTCSCKDLIGRTVTGPPDLAVCKATDRRSGRIPALPYPPLEQRVYFPLPFPLGSIGRETGKGSLSW